MRRFLYAYQGEVFKDERGEWRWQVTARNGQVVATSHDGYKNKAHAVRMCKRVCRVKTVTVT